MDGVPARIARALPRLLSSFVLLLPVASCISLEEIALQSGADPVTWEIPPRTLACHVPPEADHAHPPGDRAWVGHRGEELVAALGPPAFRLGKPRFAGGGQDYVIDVYAESESAKPGCIDAYKRNPCGAITAYECR